MLFVVSSELTSTRRRPRKLRYQPSRTITWRWEEAGRKRLPPFRAAHFFLPGAVRDAAAHRYESGTARQVAMKWRVGLQHARFTTAGCTVRLHYTGATLVRFRRNGIEGTRFGKRHKELLGLPRVLSLRFSRKRNETHVHARLSSQVRLKFATFV